MKARLILAVLAICTLFPPLPAAHALPKYGHITDYYSCDLQLVGEDYNDCSTVYRWGDQTGVFKHDEQWTCNDGTDYEQHWYGNFGGQWVELDHSPFNPPYYC